MPSQQVQPTPAPDPAAVASTMPERDATGGSPRVASALPSGRRRRTRWLMPAVVVLAAVAAGLLSLLSPLQLLELKTYDLRFVLRGQLTPPSGIVLVLIDDATEAAFPEPRIFWQPHYAEVLRAAQRGGARAIGLDVSFALSVEPWEPDFDRQLAAAFAEVSAATPVVLAYDNLQPLPQDLALYMMASAMDAVGFANVTLDADGFVRRQELLSGDDPPQESFAARLAALVRGETWTRPKDGRGELRLGPRAVPLDEAGFLRIHYWGPPATFPAVSMAEVVRAQQRQDDASLAEWFGDNIVLIGTLDPMDKHYTPFYLAGLRGAAGAGPGARQALTPGVEIQASVLATLLQDRHLRELPLWGRWAIVFAAAALAVLAIVRLRFPYGLLALLAAVSGYLAVSIASLSGGRILPVVPPVLAAVLAGLGGYGAEALTEGRRRRLLQETFGRYVSPELAAELMEYGEVPLGGTRQPVTVMFTDLRNYTSYCQGRDPHQVVEELNEYFATMSAEIKAHGGMINKFIGDGIMALFGAPVPHPEDAVRAVRCAWKMVERNEEFNRRRAAAGLPPLRIGIGLHTGAAVVGNIGAPEKMEYTAIGDAVNIAARIESENKTFGTSLLISEATYRLVAPHVEAEPAGTARMKGIEQPMVLYHVRAIQ